MKNVAPLLGRPVMAWTLDAVRGSGLFDVIHVSTDSAAVVAIAAGEGHEPEFLRPAEFAADDTPILAVTRWTLDEYDARGRRFDTAVTVQPTAVLLQAAHLRGGVEQFERTGRPVVAVVPSAGTLEKAMRLDEDGNLMPVDPLSFDRRSQEGQRVVFDAGSFFTGTPQQIREAGSTLSSLVGYLLPRHAAVDIDEEEDLELARCLLAGRIYLKNHSEDRKES